MLYTIVFRHSKQLTQFLNKINKHNLLLRPFWYNNSIIHFMQIFTYTDTIYLSHTFCNTILGISNMYLFLLNMREV